MKKYYPLVFIGFGILLVVAGLGYGVIFAGIPGPDDSPAEAARVSFHGSIAFGGACLGMLFFLAGLVMGAIRLLLPKRQPQA